MIGVLIFVASKTCFAPDEIATRNSVIEIVASVGIVAAVVAILYHLEEWMKEEQRQADRG
jgi:hypothetical protein